MSNFVSRQEVSVTQSTPKGSSPSSSLVVSSYRSIPRSSFDLSKPRNSKISKQKQKPKDVKVGDFLNFNVVRRNQEIDRYANCKIRKGHTGVTSYYTKKVLTAPPVNVVDEIIEKKQSIKQNRKDAVYRKYYFNVKGEYEGPRKYANVDLIKSIQYEKINENIDDLIDNEKGEEYEEYDDELPLNFTCLGKTKQIRDKIPNDQVVISENLLNFKPFKGKPKVSLKEELLSESLNITSSNTELNKINMEVLNKMENNLDVVESMVMPESISSVVEVERDNCNSSNTELNKINMEVLNENENSLDVVGSMVMPEPISSVVGVEKNNCEDFKNLLFKEFMQLSEVKRMQEKIKLLEERNVYLEEFNKNLQDDLEYYIQRDFECRGTIDNLDVQLENLQWEINDLKDQKDLKKKVKKVKKIKEKVLKSNDSSSSMLIVKADVHREDESEVVKTDIVKKIPSKEMLNVKVDNHQKDDNLDNNVKVIKCVKDFVDKLPKRAPKVNSAKDVLKVIEYENSEDYVNKIALLEEVKLTPNVDDTISFSAMTKQDLNVNEAVVVVEDIVKNYFEEKSKVEKKKKAYIKVCDPLPGLTIKQWTYIRYHAEKDGVYSEEVRDNLIRKIYRTIFYKNVDELRKLWASHSKEIHSYLKNPVEFLKIAFKSDISEVYHLIDSWYAVAKNTINRDMVLGQLKC